MKSLTEFIYESSDRDIIKALPFEIVSLYNNTEYKITEIEKMTNDSRQIRLIPENYPEIKLIAYINDIVKLVNGRADDVNVTEDGFDRQFRLK